MKIKLGTRGSKLALYQANLVKSILESHYESLNETVSVEIITVKTTGDRILNASLSSFGGKGLFVKEIEEALFNGGIDIAVHSLKDVPQVIPEGLEIGVTLKRDDPSDCIILKKKPQSPLTGYIQDLTGLLKKDAIVGTSSLRRRSLLNRYSEGLIFEPLRGNIDTRLGKVKKGFFDAIVLSSSGLARLNLQSYIDAYLDPSIYIPQCGQGVIAVEYKTIRDDIKEIMKPLNDEDTFKAVFAERACIRALDCGCASPVGAYAYIKDGEIYIKGFVSNTAGEYLEDEFKGKKEDYENIGNGLALRLIEKGAVGILGKNNL
ncbi:MAG: hydroxymethylbilane synthase [Candidatus Acidulodesulfobacterium acidiphilum]|uniref:Porphobilinogen deaminase n=1 Tax=Candidatus Acidulodesulfobacterium acidiphilum TaxID=2597224 RepID=A0A520XH75_9DELT|nr:MAG: hydroxymethylbilane synthase [Candidatus Acidulodesulfobacterium acidiphilum]